MAEKKDKIKIEATAQVKTTTTQTGQPVTTGGGVFGGKNAETQSQSKSPQPAPAPAQPTDSAAAPANPIGPGQARANQPPKEDQPQKPDEQKPGEQKSGEQAPNKKADSAEVPDKTQNGEQNQKRVDDIKKDQAAPGKKPSIRNQYKDLKAKHAASGVKNAGGKAATDLGKKLAKDAAVAAGRAVASAASVIATWLGPWFYVIIAVILLFIVIFGTLGCSAVNCKFAQCYPQPASKDSQQVKDVAAANAKAAKGTDGATNAGSFHNFDYLDKTDKEFVDSGKADQRLLAALKYLSDKHNRIAVSHIISGYKDMPSDPEADSQLAKNVSAHTHGLAADISQIDFVIKALEPSKVCANQHLNDVVYYGDSLPDANVSAIGSIATPQSVGALGQGTASLSEQLKKINANTAAQQNKANQLSAQMQNNQTQLQSYAQNITSTNAAISQYRTQIESGQLTPEQKVAFNQQLDILNTKLAQATQGFLQLNSIVVAMQQQINELVQNIQSNINAINGDINQVNQIIGQVNTVLDTVGGVGNISQINKIGDLNGSLGGINNILKGPADNNALAQLTGNLGGLGGLLGGSNELLRLYCEGGPATGATIKTAIPIKVTWQDTKTDAVHASADKDESLTTDPRVFYGVYQPQARKKVHNVIAELLQMPYDLKNSTYYRVTQLITFSKDRDVNPFAAALDKLYGANREPNFGLFAMPESWSQVHVGY